MNAQEKLIGKDTLTKITMYKGHTFIKLGQFVNRYRIRHVNFVQ